MHVKFRALPHAEGLPAPRYESEEAAGMDLRAAVMGREVIAPGERKLIPCGLLIALDSGFEAQVRPRSGHALKHGVTVLNSPGTIDADYRGEVKVILANFGQEPFVVERGDRIAQMIIAPVVRAVIDHGPLTGNDAEFFGAEGGRNAAGFGSTGSK